MRAPEVGAAQCGMHVANGILHVVVSARQRRYTPGFATGSMLLLPLGSAGILSIARHPAGGAGKAIIGAALGLATGVASFVGLRLRAARGA